MRISKKIKISLPISSQAFQISSLPRMDLKL